MHMRKRRLVLSLLRMSNTDPGDDLNMDLPGSGTLYVRLHILQRSDSVKFATTKLGSEPIVCRWDYKRVTAQR